MTTWIHLLDVLPDDTPAPVSIPRMLMNADFQKAFEAIKQIDPATIPDGSEPANPNLALSLKFRSLAAEVCDYFGEFGRARDFVAQASFFAIEQLRSLCLLGKVEESDRLLTRQRVWLILQAGLCEYRIADYDRARGYFEICQEVLGLPNVAGTESRLWGAQARTSYSLGLVYRETYVLDKAIACFIKSAELAYKSLSFNLSRRRGSSELANIAIARSIGMGLASVYSSIGRPDLSLPLLLASKVMLPPQEVLISTHIDLIHANIVPSTEGSAQDDENDALDQLRRCHQEFKNRKHALYQARAAASLVAAYLSRARADESKAATARDSSDLAAAEALLADVTPDSSGDMRFSFTRLALRSNIYRKLDHFRRAEEVAGLGLLEVSASRHKPVFLELILARGLARHRLGKFKAAIDDFNQGLTIAEDAPNRRLQAIFLLHMARAYAGMNEARLALATFSRFEALQKTLEVKTKDVIRLATEVRSLLKGLSQPLTFTLQDELDPDEAQRMLRRFLVNWARSKTSSDVDAAAKLGISRQTLYNWLDEPKV